MSNVNFDPVAMEDFLDELADGWVILDDQGAAAAIRILRLGRPSLPAV
ncbi:MAG: hypothetical protein M3P29_13665 [Acidobacteriota bacterium]|nr:hypothetical protein [Acidobacteriota bacterium]